MNPHPRDPRISSAYVEVARPTEPAEEPVEAIRRRMRRRSRRRKTVVGALTACVVAVVAVGAVQITADPPPHADANAGGAGAQQTGALPDGSTQSCALVYDRATLPQRDWAADATVTRIGSGATTVTVRLDVHTWYRGGSGPELHVRLPSPRNHPEDAPPPYAVGTRLLLSGARSGATLVPWSCGFTRYYDDTTAAVWAEAFAR